MVSAPDLFVLFSFFPCSSLKSSPTILFLVSPTFSKALALISFACFFSFSALAFFHLISFAALSLRPQLSHIFLQLLHQTLWGSSTAIPLALLSSATFLLGFFIRTRFTRSLTYLIESEKQGSDTALRFKAISSHSFALSLLSFGWL